MALSSQELEPPPNPGRFTDVVFLLVELSVKGAMGANEILGVAESKKANRNDWPKCLI
jgi:hypothetical protein